MEGIEVFHIGPRHQFIVGSNPFLEEIKKSHGQFKTLDNLCGGLDKVVNIKSSAQAEEKRKKKEQEHKSFFKICFSAKAITNVWIPTILTVAGTITGSILGAKISLKNRESSEIRSVSRYVTDDKKPMKELLTEASNSVKRTEIAIKKKEKPLMTRAVPQKTK